MSFAPAQPVGGRVHFSASQQSAATNNRLGRGDFMTPSTRPGGSGGFANSPLRTTVRRSANFEPVPNANPFTPRQDRSSVIASAGSRVLPRRGATLGAGGAGARTSLYQAGLGASGLGGASDEFTTGRSSLAGGAGRVSDEYAIPGVVGGWPSSEVQGIGIGAANATGDSARTPFSQPRSPAPRSASPHRSSTKLPSFLLGSAQLPKTPGTAATAYPPDSALISAPMTANSTILTGAGLNTGGSSLQSPISAHALSPRGARRLSGFGSNDMLSSAYISSAATAAGAAAGAAALDEAPPIATLDDMDAMDDEGSSLFYHSDGHDQIHQSVDAEEKPFGSQNRLENSDTTGSAAGATANVDGFHASANDRDYNDVKTRSVVVSGIPSDAESSTLNYFRRFGDVLTFDVSSTANTNTLAILYSEPWQAQRAISQGDANGRILMAGRTLLTVGPADEASVNSLFLQVFPNRAVPQSAAQSSSNAFTLSETLYAQTPRKQRSTPQPRSIGRSQASFSTEPIELSAADSPFKGGTTSRSMAGSSATGSATMATSGSILRAPAVPKARNGFFQSAIDILFGW
ncbi:hypothetical protein GGI07_001237 [Coemansia sp. Benny D115]|nr:hypothetical protein GGI07_001237 [Coemansia sp. Benny D115]